MEHIPKNQIRSINSINQDEHEDLADAKRVLPVDELGNPINTENRFPVDAIIGTGAVTTPAIANIAVASSGVEFSYTFPDNTRQASLRVRDGNAKIQYAWETGKSGTEFITVQMGNIEVVEGINLSNKTIYFQLSKGTKIVEIISYS